MPEVRFPLETQAEVGLTGEHNHPNLFHYCEKTSFEEMKEKGQNRKDKVNKKREGENYPKKKIKSNEI